MDGTRNIRCEILFWENKANKPQSQKSNLLLPFVPPFSSLFLNRPTYLLFPPIFSLSPCFGPISAFLSLAYFGSSFCAVLVPPRPFDPMCLHSLRSLFSLSPFWWYLWRYPVSLSNAKPKRTFLRRMYLHGCLFWLAPWSCILHRLSLLLLAPFLWHCN